VTEPKTGAERVRLHRERRRNRDLQLAVGVAKLVLGQGVGEQRKVLIDVLQKTANSPDIADDYRRIIDRAVDSLTSSRR
jgi:hypothetical protein